MIKIDNDVRKLKNDVLRHVARLAFEDSLSPEELDKIPFEMIPGRQPQFRCCVYKEREILRQRSRLACGSLPQGMEPHDGVITVIPSACEGCPINRFRVTENCQRCLAKHCMEACPFGAISMTGRGAYIDPDKCKECGRCANACPYNAIADLIRPCKRACPVGAIAISEDDKIAEIEQEKCIACGACMKSCPFGAISDRSYITQVIEKLKEGRKLVGVIAPALEGQFGLNATMGQLKSAIRMLGFDDAYEVALGADAVAKEEAKELLGVVASGGKMTTSCCPAFVNMIKKHFPQLKHYLSSTASPMVAVSRLVKSMDPDALVVFFGPCVAKKTETDIKDGADYILTTEELLAMLESKGIQVDQCEDSDQDGSIYGKGFAATGGVTGAVMQSILEEKGELPPIAVHRCDGAAECKKALAMLTSGKFTASFIEGMACEGGCGSGPANLQSPRIYKQARAKLLAQADGRTIGENVKAHDFEKVNIHREG